MDRERMAKEIKLRLFCPSQSEDSRELDIAANQLEQAMARIPANLRFPSAQEKGEEPKRPNKGEAGFESPGVDLEKGNQPGNHGIGLTHEAIHAHSWRPSGPKYIWISRASALEGIGYPASRLEIQKFGWKARKVRRIVAAPLVQSFADAVRGREEMARRPPPPPERQMKRRAGFEEWMEEDDLLDSGYPERDLTCATSFNGAAAIDQVRIPGLDFVIIVVRNSSIRVMTAGSGRTLTEREKAGPLIIRVFNVNRGLDLVGNLMARLPRDQI